MLWTIAVILIVLWLLGLVSSYTIGGFIHLLLVLAIVVVLVNIIQGRQRIFFLVQDLILKRIS
jgi:hypothetical protein